MRKSMSIKKKPKNQYQKNKLFEEFFIIGIEAYKVTS
jgi:hypothetical protein